MSHYRKIDFKINNNKMIARSSDLKKLDIYKNNFILYMVK